MFPHQKSQIRKQTNSIQKLKACNWKCNTKTWMDINTRMQPSMASTNDVNKQYKDNQDDNFIRQQNNIISINSRPMNFSTKTTSFPSIFTFIFEKKHKHKSPPKLQTKTTSEVFFCLKVVISSHFIPAPTDIAMAADVEEVEKEAVTGEGCGGEAKMGRRRRRLWWNPEKAETQSFFSLPLLWREDGKQWPFSKYLESTDMLLYLIIYYYYRFSLSFFFFLFVKIETALWPQGSENELYFIISLDHNSNWSKILIYLKFITTNKNNLR